METREMLLNDIRALMSHMGELTTTEDANDHQRANLFRARNLLVDAVSSLTFLSDEEIFATLDECRMQVVSRG